MSGSRVRRRTAPAQTASFAGVIVQILALDEVFSLDSVITAVGMVDELFIMVAAATIAIGIMLVSAGAISAFVNQHPTVKMLALAFLVLIGASLLGEGLDFHTPKGYMYGPIAFAILVEAVNLRYRPFRLAGATCTSSRCTCARRTSKRRGPRSSISGTLKAGQIAVLIRHDPGSKLPRPCHTDGVAGWLIGPQQAQRR